MNEEKRKRIEELAHDEFAKRCLVDRLAMRIAMVDLDLERLRKRNDIPTPRTDLAAQWVASGTGDEFQCVHASFARELERENIALLDRIRELQVENLNLRITLEAAGKAHGFEHKSYL